MMTVPLDELPPGVNFSIQLLVWAQPVSSARAMRNVVRAGPSPRRSRAGARSYGPRLQPPRTEFFTSLCIRCNLLRLYDPFLRDVDPEMCARKLTRVNYFDRAVVGFNAFQHH